MSVLTPTSPITAPAASRSGALEDCQIRRAPSGEMCVSVTTAAAAVSMMRRSVARRAAPSSGLSVYSAAVRPITAPAG